MKIKTKNSAELVKPKSTLIPSFLKMFSFIQPFLISLTFALLIIETFTYAGFVSNYIFLDVKVFMLFSIVSLIFFVMLENKGRAKNSLTNLVIKCSYLSTPIFFVLYYILIAIESSNFPNYVFSSIHVNPDNFFNVLIFNLIIAFAGLLHDFRFDYSRLPKLKYNVGRTINDNGNYLSLILKGRNFQYFLYILLTLLMGYYLLSNIILSTRRMIKSNIYIISNYNDTYDMKMYNSWHFFYKYMKFIIDNTPENASIAIPPPVRPWLSEGNSVLVRYFLYPRHLVTIEDESGVFVDPEYYIIAKGLWKVTNQSDYGWPKEKMYAEKIIYFDENNFSTNTIHDVLYDPEDHKNKMGWGIIKVDKNRKVKIN